VVWYDPPDEFRGRSRRLSMVGVDVSTCEAETFLPKHCYSGLSRAARETVDITGKSIRTNPAIGKQ
jgi:hypothetical protein